MISAKKRIKINYWIIFGIIIVLLSSVYKQYSVKRLSFNSVPQKAEIIENSPAKILKIDSLNINIQIDEGSIENGIWQISQTSVTHLNTSSNPKDGGNIVIYGHNKNNILGPIRWIKPEAEIVLINSNGEEMKYIVKSTIEVSPKEIEYVLPKDSEILTIYTCSGFADSKRFIVTATPL